MGLTEDVALGVYEVGLLEDVEFMNWVCLRT